MTQTCYLTLLLAVPVAWVLLDELVSIIIDIRK
jgi:hypothetical protein